MVGTPIATINADQRYERELEPGHYLLCVAQGGDRACAAFAVVSSKVTTINVKLRFGPASLLVFDAGSPAPRAETFDFSAE